MQFLFEFHGKAFDLPPVKIAPVPPDPIPVLIGGHSDAALRRAARLGEASVTDLIVGFRWPYVTGPDTEPLEHKLASLRRFADDIIAKQ